MRDDTFAPMTPAELAAHDRACDEVCDEVERAWVEAREAMKEE